MPFSISYRNITSYKYLLMQDYMVTIAIQPKQDIVCPAAPKPPFIRLQADGQLTICQSYAWDGPSGPTADTKNFMRGALVHDALYQLMRAGLLGQEHRKYADELLRQMCREDGMSAVRAWYVYQAVRWFAAGAARPTLADEVKVLTAP